MDLIGVRASLFECNWHGIKRDGDRFYYYILMSVWVWILYFYSLSEADGDSGCSDACCPLGGCSDL